MGVKTFGKLGEHENPTSILEYVSHAGYINSYIPYSGTIIDVLELKGEMIVASAGPFICSHGPQAMRLVVEKTKQEEILLSKF